MFYRWEDWVWPHEDPAPGHPGHAAGMGPPELTLQGPSAGSRPMQPATPVGLRQLKAKKPA